MERSNGTEPDGCASYMLAQSHPIKISTLDKHVGIPGIRIVRNASWTGLTNAADESWTVTGRLTFSLNDQIPPFWDMLVISYFWLFTSRTASTIKREERPLGGTTLQALTKADLSDVSKILCGRIFGRGPEQLIRMGVHWTFEFLSTNTRRVRLRVTSQHQTRKRWQRL